MIISWYSYSICIQFISCFSRYCLLLRWRKIFCQYLHLSLFSFLKPHCKSNIYLWHTHANLVYLGAYVCASKLNTQHSWLLILWPVNIIQKVRIFIGKWLWYWSVCIFQSLWSCVCESSYFQSLQSKIAAFVGRNWTETISLARCKVDNKVWQKHFNMWMDGTEL